MRYYLDGTTLFLRGHFTVAVQDDPALLTVPLVMITTTAAEERERAGELTAAAAGMVGPAYTLFSAGRIVTAAIARCDQVTACVHAGPASVSMVIVVNRAGPALLNGIRKTAAAAINKVLEKAGMPEYTVEVAAATEEEEEEDSPAGPESEAEVTAATTEATETALFRRSLSLPGDRAALNRPAFSIYSRFGGDHWVAWQSKDCPYYPCHMKGQSCRYCYCPFYPCEDDELGQQVISSTGKTVWNCSGCTLVHEPAVAAYLQRDPMASLCELKQVHRRRSIGPE